MSGPNQPSSPLKFELWSSHELDLSSQKEAKLPTYVSTNLDQPRNQEEWERSTQAKIRKVDTLTRNVFERINANSAAEQAARMAVQEEAKEKLKKQHKKVHAQVKIHQEFIKKSYKCIKEIEHSISQVSGAEDKLTDERYARFAESKVCEHRLQLRSKRPETERIQDEVQRLLEKQLNLLSKRREELLKNEDTAKRYLKDLREAYESLGKDIGNRRLAMRHDITTITAGEGALYKSEDLNDKRSDEICAKAYKVGATGLTFCQTCEDLVKKIRKESAAISKQVDTLLGLHAKELSKMKVNLAEQIVGAESAIDKAHLQLSHMEHRAQPGTSMEESVNQMRALCRDLQANRKNAIEDLRNKTLALDIDVSCRKVTSQLACEDAPVKKMQGSQSAPNLQAQRPGAGKLPTNAQWNGNPQQGDIEMANSFSKMKLQKQLAGEKTPLSSAQQKTALQKSSSPTHVAGGSSPLKAAATASVQNAKPGGKH